MHKFTSFDREAAYKILTVLEIAFGGVDAPNPSGLLSDFVVVVQLILWDLERSHTDHPMPQELHTLLDAMRRMVAHYANDEYDVYPCEFPDFFPEEVTRIEVDTARRLKNASLTQYDFARDLAALRAAAKIAFPGKQSKSGNDERSLG